jgi:hypothetical protein
MKKSLLLIILFAGITATAVAQEFVTPNKPYTVLSSNPGFISINELSYGFGLGDVSVPYSKSFFEFTSIAGYQVTRNFVAGAGTGVSFYNGGLLVPLFLDFRWVFYIGKITPYLYGDGGLRFNLADFGGTKLFINPGIGARYVFSRKVAVNLSGGFLFQSGGASRDSFISIKGGVVYKF